MPPLIPLRLLSAQRPFICQTCSRRPQTSHPILNPNKRPFSALPSLAVQISKVYTKPPPAPSQPPPTPLPEKHLEQWQIAKAALKAKFANQPWQPRKRLSPDALDGIRTLHQQYPTRFTTPVLAAQFEVSPEAIRRILKGKWRPTGEEAEERRRRWERRGREIWERRAEGGERPPRRWREEGVGRVKDGEGVPRWKRARWGRERDLGEVMAGGKSGSAVVGDGKKEEQ